MLDKIQDIFNSSSDFQHFKQKLDDEGLKVNALDEWGKRVYPSRSKYDKEI